MIDIKIKKLTDDAILPTYGSSKAACMDLYANCKDDVIIEPHTTEKIGTGIAMQPINSHENSGYVGLIFARSGMATKWGLRPANCVGVIDEDYTGEIIVAVHNDKDTPNVIRKGDRIAQMMWLPYCQCNLIEVNSLDETERGDGGFGHTGVQFNSYIDGTYNI